MNSQVLRDIVAARPKTLAFLAFLAFLNVALFLYLSAWQRPKLEQARSEWSAGRAAAASGQSASSAAILYQKNVRDLQLFEQRFIPKKDFAAFLSRVFQSAQAHSLSIKGITYSPTPVKEDPRLIAYAISFTVSGKYAAVKGLIADVEKFPEMVTLNSLALNNTSQTEESVDLKMTLIAYLKKEGA